VTVGQKRRRLSRSAEFDRVYRHGRSAANRNLVVYAFPRADEAVATPTGDGEGSRLGVSVGRRVGGAVVRNKVKRLLREAFWSLPEVPADHDYVIVARADARGLAERDGLEGMQRELAQLVGELGQAKREDGDA
jgi:ribonuclease P protein component